MAQSEEQKTSTAHKDYKEGLKELYSNIIIFQATYVCFLSSHNTAGRWIQDAVKWEDWDTLIQDIVQKNEDVKSLDQVWRDSAHQEEWAIMSQRHAEGLEKLDLLRTEMERFYNLISDARRDTVRNEILRWLQTVSPSAHYDAAVEKRRKYDTGSWLLRSDDFSRWKTMPNSFLWIIGKAGAGKSVLSSTVIEHLNEICRGDPYTAVVYFYINAGDKATCDVNNLTRSLVTQLFACRPDTPKTLLDLGGHRQKSGAPPQKAFEEALCSAVEGFSQVYIIIDGVDECPSSTERGSARAQRRAILDFLEWIHELGLKNLHLLITSRREQDIEDALRKYMSRHRLTALDLAASGNSRNVGQDISLFIQNELEKGIFAALSDETKMEIKNGILQKADGVFYYAYLQLNSFVAPIFEGDIQEKLKNLPRDLNETYDGALARIPPGRSPKAIRALTWTAFSQTPLTIEELAAAVPLELATSQGFDTSTHNTVEDYSASLLRSGAMKDPLQVLYLLPGLHSLRDKATAGTGSDVDRPATTSAGELHQVVVLPHFTVFEYLTSEDIKKPSTLQFALERTTASVQLADACLRYHIHLSQKGCAMESSTLRAEYPLWSYVACYGLRHAEIAGHKAWPLLLRRLIQYVLQDGSSAFAYLKVNSRYHSKATDRDMPIHYTISTNLLEITAFLLESKLADVNGPSCSKAEDRPLFRAIADMNTPMVSLLLDHGASVDDCTSSGTPALLLATNNSDPTTTRLLLDRGADINSSNPRGETALFQAVLNKDKAMARLLLAQRNPGPNANAATETGETALHWAACTGQADMVSELLSLGAQVNATTTKGEIPLLWEADANLSPSKKAAVVKNLLEYNPDLGMKNHAGDTALHRLAASNVGFDYDGPGGEDTIADVMTLLLKRHHEHGQGGDDQAGVVDARNKDGDTALHVAARTRDEALLKVLLVLGGADFNAANDKGETALFLAARGEASGSMTWTRYRRR